MSFDEMDTKAVNAIRALSIDMIEHAESGHPGMPLDAAPMAYVTYKSIYGLILNIQIGQIAIDLYYLLGTVRRCCTRCYIWQVMV